MVNQTLLELDEHIQKMHALSDILHSLANDISTSPAKTQLRLGREELLAASMETKALLNQLEERIFR